MKRNQNGFSLIELLAVLVLSTVILVPLMASYTNSIRLNDRSQNHEIASSIADGAFYSIAKIDFSEFRTLLDTANGNNEFFIEVNGTTCDTLAAAASENLCDNIFNQIWSNQTFDATEYKMYMFDYSLTTAEYNQLLADESIVPRVRNHIQNSTDITSTLDGTDLQGVIRVIVWIDYYDDPDQFFVMEGLIADE